ncbi:ABC transporter permease [Kitasatospora sp. NPDC094019]|uniref:ABC transporter permease n=1 Tax=Kitasatospora sp. NPDC094019 TaxID=3364091 RepID=UPI00382A47BA
MLTYLIRRLAAGILLLAVVTVLAFALLYAGSGDVALKILGGNATPAALAHESALLGVDRPFWTQFGTWASHALRGDLGRSWSTGQDVTQGILSRLPVTLSLVLGTTLITAVLAGALGVWAAVRRGTVDRIVQGVSLLGIALPGFVVALLLVTVFAVQLKIFPATGYTAPATSVGGWLASITLPVLALAVGSTVAVTQQVRGAVIDTLGQDWVRTLRTRGLPRRRLLAGHVLRNAAGPAVTVLGMQIIGLLGGAVIVEQVFALPGLGQLSIAATGADDLPVVMGLVMMTTLGVVIVNLATDLLQAWLTPKARLA